MKSVRSDALLLRSTPYGETDLVVQLLTDSEGKLSAIARGGRASRRRVGGALEPIHLLSVDLEDRGRELLTLKEARIVRPRVHVERDLGALDAAGAALRWARALCPPRTPEPAAWATLNHLLDALDQETRARSPKVELAAAALRLLGDVGYALDFERCVGCGRARPAGRAAYVDAARGGVVCTECGGAQRLLEARLLDVARAAQNGDASALTDEDAGEMLALVEESMAAHAGIEA